MSKQRQFLSAAELARLTGKTVRTARRWIASGAVPSKKVGGSRLVPIAAVLDDPDLAFLDDFATEDDNAEK